MADYIELEYIEDTGTQYIDTGYKFSSTKQKVELVVMPIQLGDNRICGSFILTSCNHCGMIIQSRQTNMIEVGDNSFTPNFSMSVNTEYHIVLTANNGNFTFNLNDNTATGSYSPNTVITGLNHFILGTNWSGSVNSAKAKLYWYKMWDNDVLVRDFIPIKRKSDNEICLYDKVTRQYFTNQGTGEFIAGPEISEPTLYENVSSINTQINRLLNISNQILDKYKELEYLQNSSGAYFELDYKPNSNTKIITKFSTSTTRAWQALFRSKTDNIKGTINFGKHDTSSYRYYLNNGSHLENFMSGLNTNTVYTFEFTNSYYKKDNGTQNTIKNAPVQYQSTENLYLLQTGTWKLYNFKIHENEDLLFDLVPIKRSVDNKVCLLNKVNNSVLEGTGVFIGGPEI